MRERKHVLLIDWSNFVMRKLHQKRCDPEALAPHLEVSLLGVLQQVEPTHLALCLDPRPGMADSFRYRLYPQYKEKDTAPEVTAQEVVEAVMPWVERMGLARAWAPGYEADDVIASLATEARERGTQVTVLSTDHDLWQLVDDPLLRVLYPQKGTTTWVGDAEVKERWGVLPVRIPDLKAMIGDVSDNLPRLGFSLKEQEGEKRPWGFTEARAAALLREHGDLREIYAKRDTLPERERYWLEKGNASPLPLHLRRRLMRLVRNARVEVERERLDASRFLITIPN